MRAFGAMIALLARGKTGRGQCIDAALYECAFSFMEPWIPAYDKLGHVANRSGSRLPESTPNNLYATGDGSFIHITAMGDAVFRRLAAAMGQPELAEDERFRAATARSANHEDLDDIIGRWTASLPLATLETVLEEAGVPATRIFTIADIFDDPHYQARGVHRARARRRLRARVAMANVVPRLSATPGRGPPCRPPRRRGHARSPARRCSAWPTSAIDALQASGVIACETTATGTPSP